MASRMLGRVALRGAVRYSHAPLETHSISVRIGDHDALDRHIFQLGWRVLLVTAHTNADLLAAQRRAVGTAVQRTATANAPRTGGTSPSPLFFFGSVAGESFDMRATALPSPNHSLSRHPLDAVYKA